MKMSQQQTFLKQCPNCGHEFDTPYESKEYCSSGCQGDAYRREHPVNLRISKSERVFFEVPSNGRSRVGKPCHKCGKPITLPYYTKNGYGGRPRTYHLLCAKLCGFDVPSEKPIASV